MVRVQPTIHAGTLTLRPLVPGDVAALHGAGQDEAIGCYTSITWPFTPEAARALIADAAADWETGTAARFAITEKGDAGEVFLGTASLLHIYPEQADAEVGYWLAAAARGRGLARAAVSALCAWALGPFGLRRLHLLTDQDNIASQRLARSCGFHANGTTFWRHPTEPQKDALCLLFERAADRAAVAHAHS
jgi:RimJ/RimL family protein N-acetyltransferase